MDSETLDRLMLDRGLGALPPDCEALLDAYLDAHPRDATACRRIRDTIDLACKTLRPPPVEALPPFPADRLLRAQRTVRTWRLARNVTGIAAAIAIGFVAHATMFRAAPPPPEQAAPAVVARGGSERVPEAVREDAGFWSGRRLCEQASVAMRQSPNRLTWESPVKAPHIRGAS